MDESIRLRPQPLMAPESFNDDDFYIVCGLTNRLIGTASSRSPEPTPKPGQIVMRGMLAKRLPVWNLDVDDMRDTLRVLGSSV